MLSGQVRYNIAMSFMKRLRFNLMYTSRPPWDSGITPPEVVEFMETHTSGRALDLGCGTGTNAINLAKRGWQVIGVDFAGRAISDARRKARRSGVQVDFQVGDVTRLDKVSGSFDLILDIGCYHNLENDQKESYARRLETLLSASGTYMLYLFVKDAGQEGPGVSPKGLLPLTSRLTIIRREEGSDHGLRSAWIWFNKGAAK